MCAVLRIFAVCTLVTLATAWDVEHVLHGACSSGVALTDVLLVNVSLSVGAGETKTLPPFTLHQMCADGEDPLSELLLGACPGDVRRARTEARRLRSPSDDAIRLPAALRAFLVDVPHDTPLLLEVSLAHATRAVDYAIIDALQDRNFAEAIRLVSDGAVGVNARDPMGMTPLMIAVRQRQNVLAASLFNAWERRVDVNAVTPEGHSALFYAIEADDKMIARALLKRGANPNTAVLQPASGGWTALHFACRFGSVPLVELLLQFGADPLAMGHAGESVFQVAEDAKVDYTTRKKIATILNAALDQRANQEL